MRKFEVVQRFKDRITNNTDNVVLCKLPERSTKHSAGYDFFCPEDTVCKSHQITMIKTGMKAYMEKDETLLLFNRSSNPKKKGLVILNGVRSCRCGLCR